MKVECLVTGFLQENCYLLEKNGKCLLIDPGEGYLEILKFIKDREVLAILLTHSHFDHIASVSELVQSLHCPVLDVHNLEEGSKHLEDFAFSVIYTFGHTMDSITFYFPEEKLMFTGDFLFYQSIGRCDFKESDERKMRESIEKISQYDDDIVVYPGHGCRTILGFEKKGNPYF